MRLIKRILPKSLINYLRLIKYNIVAIKSYRYDRKRYISSAFTFNSSKENIEGRILINLHSIEKGLTNSNFRIGFGQNALRALMEALSLYSDMGYDKKGKNFKAGISILNEYVIRHLETNIDNSHIIDFISQINTDEIENISGIEIFQKSQILDNSQFSFKRFSDSRSSIRDYSEIKVDNNLIYEALNIAKNTPSVCNRQPWKVHIISNDKIINDVLLLQNGFKGYGDNLHTLILITSNNSFLSSIHERNQGFIDAGLYSMNLIYSLHSLGIATCPLNAALSLENDLKVRKILNISENENLCMFIALGNYKDEVVTTKSPTKELNSYVVHH